MRPTAPPIAYDELYVVSDLHLGGDPERRTFDQPEELSSLVEHVIGRPPGVRAGLVLNGDTIDFRALDPPEHFAAEGGPEKLRGVLRDGALSKAVDALRRLVRTRDRRLVVVPGNHDAELALPAVEKVLRDELCQDDRRASRRLLVEPAEGDGRHAAYVGPARVLCVHGDEVDPWDVVDREQLVQQVATGVDGAAGLDDGEPPRWRPSPGCELYMDTLRPLFKRYPWVRVCPATPLLGPLLFALVPEVGGRDLSTALRLAVRVFARRSAIDRRPSLQRFPARSAAVVRVATAADGPAPDAAEVGPPGGDPVIATLLALLFPGRRRELARLALQPPRDGSLALDYVDEQQLALEDRIAPEIDFLVTGHTHRPRALRRQRGHGVYLNTGSWTKVLAPRAAFLEGPEAFEPLYQALLAGSLSALDQVPGGVMRRRPVVARLRAEGSTVIGELCLARAGAALDSIKGTRFDVIAAGEAREAG